MPDYKVFVPTPPEIVREKLRLAGVQPGETVFDFGCSDGAPLIIAAQEFEARGVGIEARSELIEESKQAIRAAGLDDRIQLRCEDFMNSDFSHATMDKPDCNSWNIHSAIVSTRTNN